MRWIFRSLGAILLLVVIAIAALALVPAEKIADLVAGQLADRTGRDIRLEGDIKPVFFPILGVRASGVRIGNANWSEHGTMISADSLLSGVSPGGLFTGNVDVTEFRLENPIILLERSKSGQSNWEFDTVLDGADAPAVEASDEPAFIKSISVQQAQISGGTITFIDHLSGTQMGLSALDLKLAAPDFDGEASATAVAEVNGEKIELTAEAVNFRASSQGRYRPSV